MDNITSKETMEEFIGKIIDGQGNFFKPLSKSDLYKLATRIRELEAEVKSFRDSQGVSPQLEHDVSDADCHSDAGDEDGAEEHEKPCADGDGDAQEHETAFPASEESHGRTWREVLAQRGADAQDAFDEFIRWRDKHPKQYSVMDFTTGKKSAGAAFAFWLTGTYQEG